MQLVSFEENSKEYSSGDFVSASIQIWQDSLLIYNKNKAYTFLPKKHDFDIIFQSLNQGDSAIFMILPKKIKNNSFGYNLVTQTNNYFKVIIKIHRYFNPKEHVIYVNQQNYKNLEQVFLQEYLKENELDSTHLRNGVYTKIINEGIGEGLENGDVVYFQYVGSFVDKNEFDNTYKKGIPFEYTLGTPGQVIKGLEIALKGMKKNNKSKIIISSHLAFGENGSSTGIVPPYTTVIYELEIINVLKKVIK